jgi:diguanylate cyclase (GGDEF)-like protein/PAS domain S-box-containing protein
MRLRNWIAVGVSVILLLAVGSIGIVVNRSALRAADTVHRADSQALAVNNTTLAGQLQLLSAAELNAFPANHILNLGSGDLADRQALTAFAAKTTYFQYGMVITDLTGAPLNSTRASGLPSATDAGYAPLRASLLAGQPGFSSIMTVDGVALEAVAVPIMVGGAPAAVLIGFNDVAKTQLQAYVVKLSDQVHRTMIVDSTGRVAATSADGTIGTLLEPQLIASARGAVGAKFVDYRSGGTKMIAIVIGGMPGGWAYVRTQSTASFEGAVHSRNQTINLLLIAMLLIGAVGVTILGYRTQTVRRRADERFQALFQHAPDLVAVLDAEGRIAYSSPSAGAVLNVEPGSLSGTRILDIVHPDDRERVGGQLAKLMTERDGVVRVQTRVAAPGGPYQWFEVTASNQMHNPSLNGIVVNARDVSENHAFQERLTHEAEHDPLTGLPNRRRMQDALGSSLRTEPVAVLFVDLDGFKPVNDAYGHETGDELLRQVAERLSACVRENDVLARVGGDEFVMLMPGVINPADAEAMSARFRAAINAPFVVGGVEVEIGASVGVHLATSTDDPDQALRAADHAMYRVKRAGGSRRAVRTDDRRDGRHRREAKEPPQG